MNEAQNPLVDIFEDRCHPSVVASGPFKFAAPHWREDGTCSHCGGIKPSIALKAIVEGAQVVPTDKSYKIYVDIPNANPDELRVVSVISHDPDDPENWKPADPVLLKRDGWGAERAKWMQLVPRGPVKQTKCYLNHFSESQALEFVKLVETGKMKMGYPGHFYRPLALGRYKPAIEKLLAELKPKPAEQ